MNTDQLLSTLAHKGEAPSFQNPMMPWFRKMVHTSQKTMDQAKKAAVLAHLFEGSDGLELLFMKRPPYDGTHGGQISFPGGRKELSDSSYEQTALRETAEEVGIPKKSVTVIRKLDPLYIPPSNFVVHPFIGYSKELPELVLDPNEVAYTFSIPLQVLMSGELIGKATVPTKYGKVKVPAYLWGDEVIWGATAMITARIVGLLS
ncbi:MAG: NUDIX hydrolase [Schleiferiaceae bacterium]